MNSAPKRFYSWYLIYSESSSDLSVSFFIWTHFAKLFFPPPHMWNAMNSVCSSYYAIQFGIKRYHFYLSFFFVHRRPFFTSIKDFSQTTTTISWINRSGTHLSVSASYWCDWISSRMFTIIWMPFGICVRHILAQHMHSSSSNNENNNGRDVWIATWEADNREMCLHGPY